MAKKTTTNDPWLDNFMRTPEQRAKWHIFVTIAYIVFILMLIIGIGAVFFFLLF